MERQSRFLLHMCWNKLVVLLSGDAEGTYLIRELDFVHSCVPTGYISPEVSRRQ